ncbi:MAG TPA: archaemetzincin family Zn-dependent metalloprotease [Thermoanaerobaculia bacterium]
MSGGNFGIRLIVNTLMKWLLLLLLFSVDPNAPSRRLVLIPIGAVSDDTLLHLKSELAVHLRREVFIGEGVPLPASAYRVERNQYLGEALLKELETRDSPDATRVIGIIDGDAYAPGLNFIFGQARKPGRFAVVALSRLRQGLTDRPDDVQRFRARAAKVATHEIGHTFGLSHCEDRECVMHFANSVFELDDSGSRYCEREGLR